MRILRNEEALQFELLRHDVRRQLRQFILHDEFPRGCGIGLERDESAVALDQRAQTRIFHRQLTELVLPRDDAGVRQQAADFLESLVEFLEFASDGIFHGREL